MLKKILPIFLIVILINFSACTINFNKEKDSVNGLYESKVLTSNVTVSTYIKYKDEYKYAQGSGVIFYRDNSSYYVLTNNHVLYGANYFTIMDSYGLSYEARSIYKDSNYDLAILKFYPENADYFVPTIASEDPKENTPIISIGSPNGIINTTTLGKVLKYEMIDSKDEANLNEVGNTVSFEVLSHDAILDGGSSGGAIFNYEYQICGINFASGVNDKKEFISGYAIQPTKIMEFLRNAGFNI